MTSFIDISLDDEEAGATSRMDNGAHTLGKGGLTVKYNLF
jgi:hypothetical protein